MRNFAGQLKQDLISHNIVFQSLTNWGRDEIVTDLQADDNSVQVVVFYSFIGTATNNIAWTLNYGDDVLNGQTEIEVVDEPLPLVRN